MKIRSTRHSTVVAGVVTMVVTATFFGLLSSALANPSDPPTLDEATARALQLEEDIDDLRGEQVSIEERIAVTNLRIFSQQEVLAKSRETLRDTQNAYQQRVVRIYKQRNAVSLSLLLEATSLSDFYARAMMLTRIVERDRLVFKDAAVAAAEAEYQAAYLDELKAQDVALRMEKRNRLSLLTSALSEQETLIDQLTEEQKQIVADARATISMTRKQWIESSVPIGTQISLVPAVVEPSSQTFLTSEYHPDRFRATGKTLTAVCSWYGNEFNGRPTACGQIFNQDDLTCASRTLPFGTWLALSRNGKRIIVVVTDRGPFIDGRDLDLSRRAAQELGFSGVEPVHVEFVEPLVETP